MITNLEKLKNGKDAAAVITAFNSQLPGPQSIAATLLAPSLPANVLTKAFQVGTKITSRLAPKTKQTLHSYL